MTPGHEKGGYQNSRRPQLYSCVFEDEETLRMLHWLRFPSSPRDHPPFPSSLSPLCIYLLCSWHNNLSHIDGAPKHGLTDLGGSKGLCNVVNGNISPEIQACARQHSLFPTPLSDFYLGTQGTKHKFLTFLLSLESLPFPVHLPPNMSGGNSWLLSQEGFLLHNGTV